MSFVQIEAVRDLGDVFVLAAPERSKPCPGPREGENKGLIDAAGFRLGVARDQDLFTRSRAAIREGRA